MYDEIKGRPGKWYVSLPVSENLEDSDRLKEIGEAAEKIVRFLNEKGISVNCPVLEYWLSHRESGPEPVDWDLYGETYISPLIESSVGVIMVSFPGHADDPVVGDEIEFFFDRDLPGYVLAWPGLDIIET